MTAQLQTEVRVATEDSSTRLEPRELLLGKAGTTCALDNDVLIAGPLDVNPLPPHSAVELPGKETLRVRYC